MPMPRATISDAYRIEQQLLHQDPRYGVASLAFAPLVRSLLKAGGCQSVSDYGAGKCNLKLALGLEDGGAVAYYPHDPAFPEYGPPRSADLLTCIDVLEHVEPDKLDALLSELSSLTRKLALLTIHTGPAKKILSDGRNAHLIQQPQSWWLERLAAHFAIVHVQSVPKGFFVLATAKGGYAKLCASLDLGRLTAAASRARPRRRGLAQRIWRAFPRFYAGSGIRCWTILSARVPFSSAR